MKNGLIVILCILSAWLFLDKIGAFGFSGFMDRDFRLNYAARRTKAVEKSEIFTAAVIYDGRDLPAKKSVKGVFEAVEMLNAKGGILGKKIVLNVFDDAYGLQRHNMRTEKAAENDRTAVLIAPFNSDYIPSMRALTQYYALPMVSPLTVRSEKIPELVPDNFVTVFPEIGLWSSALIRHMTAAGVKKVLVVSGGDDSYSDIFSTALEREGRRRGAFHAAYRLNYQLPLKKTALMRALNHYMSHETFGALFFGGRFHDFVELNAMLNEAGSKTPVYGTDDLDVAALDGLDTGGRKIFLPYLVLNDEHPEFSTLWRKKYGEEPPYEAVLGAKAVFETAAVLESTGSYNPDTLSEKLAEIISRTASSGAAQIKIRDATPARKEKK